MAILDIPRDDGKHAFENEVFVFQHKLHEMELFSDESLCEIIASHPPEFCNVSRMGDNPEKIEWSEGDWSHLSPEELLETVKQGRLWINIRRVVLFQPRLEKIINDLYDEVENQCGMETFRRQGNLLISSPHAMVYAHIDVPPNVLWHIRGEKRVWAYPNLQHDIAPDFLDGIIAMDRVEDIPYRSELDDRAVSVVLKPGEVITWPQNTPHRVVNLDSLNVSLSTEHYTRDAFRFVRVVRANEFLKRNLKLPCKSRKTSGLGYTLKTGTFLAARAMQKLLRRGEGGFDYPKDFIVDPDSPNGVRFVDRPADPIELN